MTAPALTLGATSFHAAPATPGHVLIRRHGAVVLVPLEDLDRAARAHRAARAIGRLGPEAAGAATEMLGREVLRWQGLARDRDAAPAIVDDFITETGEYA